MHHNDYLLFLSICW